MQIADKKKKNHIPLQCTTSCCQAKVYTSPGLLAIVDCRLQLKRKKGLHSNSLHYRLRLIESGHQRILNFASHFICLQIFQIGFQPSASFYQCPNIPDTFLGVEMHSSPLELGRKRVELNVRESFKYFTQELLRKYLKKNICNFKSPISP